MAVLPFLYNVRPRFRPNFRPNNKSSEVEAKAAIAGCNHYKNNASSVYLFICQLSSQVFATFCNEHTMQDDTFNELLEDEFELNLLSNLEDNDDLKVMCDMAAAKNSKGLAATKMLNKNLFNVVCCLAGESVGKVGKDINQKIFDFNARFQFWSQEIARTEEFRSNLLRLFPGRELPQSFFDYVKTMRTAPTAKFIKDRKLENFSAEQQTDAKFGALVKAQFDSCKREINRILNPLWRPASMLPSGVSCYAYLYFMRKQLWPSKALEFAGLAMKTAFKRGSTTKYNKKDHVVAISERAAKYKFSENWYPDYWLVFLYLGKPAGENARRSFTSGEAVVEQLLPSIRSMANKETRGAVDSGSSNKETRGAVVSGSSIGSSSSAKKARTSSPDTEGSGSDETVKKFTYRHSYDPLNALIANLKDQAATMVLMKMDLNCPEYKGVLTALLKAQQAAMERIEKEIAGSAFATPT